MRAVNGVTCARDAGPLLYLADVVTAVIPPRVLAVCQVGYFSTIREPTDSNVCQIK